MPSDPPENHGGAVELAEHPTSAPRISANLPSRKEILAEIKGANSEHSLEEQDDALLATKSTREDAAGMRRMGKDQQLIRNFRLLSITSFVALATAAWEIGLFLISPGLIDGGRAGLVWNSLQTFIFFGPIYLSMAEMASMAPIAGAQYHWVSEFAPARYQKFLSYLTGYDHPFSLPQPCLS